MTYTLSTQLREYGEAIKSWGHDAVRPLARIADESHALPEGWQLVLDTCPVALPRVDGRQSEPLRVPEGEALLRNVTFESISYCDPWLIEALNGGIGHLVVKSIGNAEQVKRWYVPIIESGGRTAFALSEPQSGSDTSGLRTTARRDGDTWVLNGTKMYCSEGAVADYIVVFATVDTSLAASGIKAFLVERDAPGVAILRANEDKMGLRCWVTSLIGFDDCVIPVENILGWTGDSVEGLPGMSAALACLNGNRPNVSAIAVGLGQASIDMTRAILSEQVASIAPRRLAAIEVDLENMEQSLHRARRLNHQATWLDSTGRSNRIESSIAKMYGPPNVERIIRRCMQLLGPEGSSRELLLEKWYRDVKILDIFEGTGQIMRLIVSRAIVGRQSSG